MSRRIVLTSGCWDELHEGHLNILRRSKELAGPGGILVVGVVTDLGAAAYKPHPLIWTEHHRLAVISALDMVDVAVLQPGTDPSPLIQILDTLGCRPDVMTHGSDWSSLREGQDTLTRLGIEWELIPYTPGVSSTEIRQRIASLQEA